MLRMRRFPERLFQIQVVTGLLSIRIQEHLECCQVEIMRCLIWRLAVTQHR